MSKKKPSAPAPKKTVKSGPAKTARAPRAVGAKAPVKRVRAKAKVPRIPKPRALSKEARIAMAQLAKESRRLERIQERERREQQKKDERDAKARDRVAARQERLAEKERKRLEARAERTALREKLRAERPATPRAPRPGLPKLKRGLVLAEVEMLKSWDERPLTGRDLDTLCHRFGLNSTEFASALGWQNRFQFATLIKTAAVVPFEVEMLARLYDSSPSPAPWVSFSADQAFQVLYGPALQKFDDTEEDLAYARTLFYARFTASLDRSSSTAYRWVEDEGKARLQISLFLRKLMSVEKPLKTLEELARLVHRVRGGDFEARAPHPQQGSRKSRRGRAAKVNRVGKKPDASGLPIKIKPLVL